MSILRIFDTLLLIDLLFDFSICSDECPTYSENFLEPLVVLGIQARGCRDISVTAAKEFVWQQSGSFLSKSRRSFVFNFHLYFSFLFLRTHTNALNIL